MTSVFNFQDVIVKHLGSRRSDMRVLNVTWHLVHILEVTSQVATLREGLMALRTVVGSLTCVLAEVIPQIAAFLEYTFTTTVHAFEIELDALRHFMFDLDRLMPLLGNAFERSRFNACDNRVDIEHGVAAQIFTVFKLSRKV